MSGSRKRFTAYDTQSYYIIRQLREVFPPVPNGAANSLRERIWRKSPTSRINVEEFLGRAFFSKSDLCHRRSRPTGDPEQTRPNCPQKLCFSRPCHDVDDPAVGSRNVCVCEMCLVLNTCFGWCWCLCLSGVLLEMVVLASRSL